MDRPIGFTSRPFWHTPAIVRTEWNISTISALLMTIVMLTVIGWLYLEQAAMIRETEMDIEVLEHKRIHLMEEYRTLQWQIAELQSADQVLAHAGPLNLHDAVNMDTLHVPLIAGTPDTRGRFDVLSQDVEHEQEAWALSAARWLEAFVSPQPGKD